MYNVTVLNEISLEKSSSEFDVVDLLYLESSQGDELHRWLFHGVCFLGNFLLARCFPFCEEGMTAGHWL